MKDKDNWHNTIPLKQKWRWAGHIARMKDNRWTKRCTEWQPRRGKRSRGRPCRRWQDDITRKGGTTWNRKQQTEDNGRHWWRATSCSGWTKPTWKVKQESNRQRTMEGIDGGLHPAVDGQSLRERWNRKATDRRQWKTLMEGYILQWMDKAWVKGETWKQQTEDNERHWWKATSCSGWTKPGWKVKGERWKESLSPLLWAVVVPCLFSYQHVSHGWICSDNCTCCHTDTEVADLSPLSWAAVVVYSPSNMLVYLTALLVVVVA